MDNNSTITFSLKMNKDDEMKKTLIAIYDAFVEKGYDNPINQIVGYIMSGDPTYITSHNNARGLIAKVERDDLIEEAVKFYIDNKLK